MISPFLSSLLAGLLSAGLFWLVVEAGLGFFFLFLPTLPLFLPGLSRRPSLALHAALIAALLIAVPRGAGGALAFLALFGLPAWHMARQAALWREDAPGARLWYPLGLVMAQLTLYACAIAAAVGLYLAATQEAGLHLLVADHIRAAFAVAQAEYGPQIELMAGPLSFLLFSIAVWLWALTLFAHGWLAHRLLKRRGENIRPDFAVGVFAMPNLVLGLVAGCAALSLLGGAELAFLAKSLLIMLLLPYFFLGAALMHEAAASWPNRRFLLAFIYILLFLLFWPALLIAGAGLLRHIKDLSGDASSTRN